MTVRKKKKRGERIAFGNAVEHTTITISYRRENNIYYISQNQFIRYDDHDAVSASRSTLVDFNVSLRLIFFDNIRSRFVFK